MSYGTLREELHKADFDVDAIEDALEALAQEHGQDAPIVREAERIVRRHYAGALRHIKDKDPVVGYIGAANITGGRRVRVDGTLISLDCGHLNLDYDVYHVFIRRSGRTLLKRLNPHVHEVELD